MYRVVEKRSLHGIQGSVGPLSSHALFSTFDNPRNEIVLYEWLHSIDYELFFLTFLNLGTNSSISLLSFW